MATQTKQELITLLGLSLRSPLNQIIGCLLPQFYHYRWASITNLLPQFGNRQLFRRRKFMGPKLNPNVGLGISYRPQTLLASCVNLWPPAREVAFLV